MKTHTGYSFRTAYGPLENVVNRLKEVECIAAPISDRNSTFGFTRFTKLAKAAGLKPVYGVELGVTPALGEKKPALDYWAFFATKSLRPLHDLIKLATSNPGKEPQLTYRQALGAHDLIKISGERLLMEHLPNELPDDYYFGLMPSTPRGLFKLAEARKLQLCASWDNYYPTSGDEEIYRVALGLRSGTQTYPRHILTNDEWWNATEDVCPQKLWRASAIATRNALLAGCHAEQVTAELLHYNSPTTLRELCIESAPGKNINLEDPVYAERFERELKLIREKDFEDYFFILSDIVRWARMRMLVGPARGSSCGSLVCFLLDITTIDPIPFDLLFERFIDINRKDLPDIDVDFSDQRRHLVLEYAEQKFGKTHVARLGTVGLFAPRSAIKQAATVLVVPDWRINKVTDVMIERSSGDSRASLRLADTLAGMEQGKILLKEFPEMEVAGRLEGHPQNASQHAAGIIVTAGEVLDYVAVDGRTNSTMCDKKDAEVLNLLKIDALGLTQLSIFERTLELIGEPISQDFFARVPLDDPAAFKVLNDGKYAGIFQFVGVAVRSLTGQCKVDRFDDIVALGALARPGPLATGAATRWLTRRMGREEVTTLHPLLTELTRETYGVVIYQEQVMRIARELGKLSWEDTSIIRKAMSGRQGDEVFAKHRANFIKGAGENGIDAMLADQIWKQISTFGSWAFNKSHAVAYAFISYWCMWFKAHHPMEFAAATLDAEADATKQINILRELAAEGVSYKPFDPEQSNDRWGVAERDGQQMLVGPLTMIKSIGVATLREILDCRAAGQPIRPTLQKRLDNAKTPIDSLTPIMDRVKELHPDLTAIGIVSPVTPIIKVRPNEMNEAVVVAIVKTINPRDENEPVRVQQRGGKMITDGFDKSINLFFIDDSDEIYCKIDRFRYPVLSPMILQKARAGKSLFAIKGQVPNDFRMINIRQMKYLGEMDEGAVNFKSDARRGATQNEKQEADGMPGELGAGAGTR